LVIFLKFLRAALLISAFLLDLALGEGTSNVSEASKAFASMNIGEIFIWEATNVLLLIPVVKVSELCRNLETLFCPRLKVSTRKLGELIPLKLLVVSERRRLVS